jgi:L-aspartate oxidase
MKMDTDCAVIGAGFAGCSAAIELADAGYQVDVFVKGELVIDSASTLTAGGLAAVSDEAIRNGEDSYKAHIKDTLDAGKGLNDERIVKFCVEHFYPDAIEWLTGQGVRFDGLNHQYDMHREGGHSAKRVFHIEDETGKHIMAVLAEKIRNHPKIRVHEKHIAIDIITKNKFLKMPGKDECVGIYVYDIGKDQVKAVSSKSVFLATGGLGKVFLYTSNPEAASGDGFSMAYRAGLPLANMEFIQFHPTVYYDEQADSSERRYLFTEALRGEGAILKLAKDDKDDFTLKYDPQGSKATRDIVTRAEDMEMRKNGLKHVWLDCTRIPEQRLKKDFRSAFEFCLKKGIDMAKDSIPVVYAVHYSNGGVLVDENSETELENLYVLGEASYTGLHGATRLASNSSPECLLFGRVSAKHFIQNKSGNKNHAVPDWDTGRAKESKDPITISCYWEITRKTMTLLCGIARTKERLCAAKDVLFALKKNINSDYWNHVVKKEFLEARNLADVANIVLDSALARKESRACHYREDYPQSDGKYLGITIVQRDKEPRLENIKHSS